MKVIINKYWKNIKREDILKAIEFFDQHREKYPEPKNTFLIFNDKKYPAKHIRGLAYKVANGKEISKSEYSGGEETANFFKKHGFSIQYKKESMPSPSTSVEEIKQSKKITHVINHKISRLILTGKQHYKNGSPNIRLLDILIDKFLSNVYHKFHFEFILTPGGFLTFEFPDELRFDIDISKAEDEQVGDSGECDHLIPEQSDHLISEQTDHLIPVQIDHLLRT